MAYEIIFAPAVILLLAVICFLLYKLYRIKYREGKVGGIIPESWKKDLTELDDGVAKEIETRLKDVNSRISQIEERIKKNERVVEKLVEELG